MSEFSNALSFLSCSSMREIEERRNFLFCFSKRVSMTVLVLELCTRQMKYDNKIEKDSNRIIEVEVLYDNIIIRYTYLFVSTSFVF